jgi:hypothetical protein
LRVEQRLHRRLDRHVLHAAALHARALHRVAKRTAELARARTQIAQPRSSAIGQTFRLRAHLPEFVLHAEQRGRDGLGLRHEIVEAIDRAAGLHETRCEDRGVDAVHLHGAGGAGDQKDCGQHRQRPSKRHRAGTIAALAVVQPAGGAHASPAADRAGRD